VHVLAGEPVDLSAYLGRPQDAQTLHAVTELVMSRITDLLVQLRGGEPPAVPYDPRGKSAAA
jgi:hypothetical protein